jgi:hypothetical protein
VTQDTRTRRILLTMTYYCTQIYVLCQGEEDATTEEQGDDERMAAENVFALDNADVDMR